MVFFFIAAVRQTVFERTLSHYVTPLSLEAASLDPTLHTSGSPPLSLAKVVGREKSKIHDGEEGVMVRQGSWR